MPDMILWKISNHRLDEFGQQVDKNENAEPGFKI